MATETSKSAQNTKPPSSLGCKISGIAIGPSEVFNGNSKAGNDYTRVTTMVNVDNVVYKVTEMGDKSLEQFAVEAGQVVNITIEKDRRTSIVELNGKCRS